MPLTVGLATTSSRHCQQKDEMMELEEEGRRLLAQRTCVTPEHERTIEQRLELLAIYRATEQIKSETLENLIRVQEKFQRHYLLHHNDNSEKHTDTSEEEDKQTEFGCVTSWNGRRVVRR